MNQMCVILVAAALVYQTLAFPEKVRRAILPLVAATLAYYQELSADLKNLPLLSGGGLYSLFSKSPSGIGAKSSNAVAAALFYQTLAADLKLPTAFPGKVRRAILPLVAATLAQELSADLKTPTAFWWRSV